MTHSRDELHIPRPGMLPAAARPAMRLGRLPGVTLYHYTCADGYSAIRRDGLIRPYPCWWLGGVKLAWFTDDPEASREALGLTSETLRCDRMAHRLVVVTDKAARWTTWAHRFRVPSRLRDALEEGRAPRNWWVSEEPILIDDATGEVVALPLDGPIGRRP